MKNQNFFSRLGFAFRGLSRLGANESSFKVHLIFAVATISFGYYLSLSPLWWAVIILSIGFVLVTETINTALEILCDVVQPEYSESIRDIKDMMAGAVLLAAIVAVGVGITLIYTNRDRIFNLF